MIITLCGSSKFKEQYINVAANLTMQGHIVFAPNIYEHADEIELTPEQKIQLENLTRQKIEMSDMVLVINPDQYIGESTFGEVDWAQKLGKKINLLEPISQPEVNKEEEQG